MLLARSLGTQDTLGESEDATRSNINFAALRWLPPLNAVNLWLTACIQATPTQAITARIQAREVQVPSESFHSLPVLYTTRCIPQLLAAA